MRPFGDTGVQTHFRAFADWLSSEGRLWKVVTPFCSPKFIVYPVFGVRRVIDAISPAFSVWWYRKWHMHFLYQALRKAMRSEGACVIYAQCPLSAAAALKARRSVDQRVVMVVHFNVSQADEWRDKGKIADEGRIYKSILRFEEQILPALDGLVFVSDFMRRALVERVPAVGEVPCRVVPNFLADSGDAKEPDTVSVGDLICVGTLEPRKNQRYAIEIVAAALGLGKTIHLTIVGDGPDRGSLLELARMLGVEHCVRFMGYVRHAAYVMKSHRACLHVARIENLPLTLIEAMAAGIPLFAPKVGGIPEIFSDGREGYYIPLDKAKEAAEVILRLLEDPAGVERFGVAGRVRYLSRFASNVVAADLLLFLDSTGHVSEALATGQHAVVEVQGHERSAPL